MRGLLLRHRRLHRRLLRELPLQLVHQVQEQRELLLAKIELGRRRLRLRLQLGDLRLERRQPRGGVRPARELRAQPAQGLVLLLVLSVEPGAVEVRLELRDLILRASHLAVHRGARARVLLHLPRVRRRDRAVSPHVELVQRDLLEPSLPRALGVGAVPVRVVLGERVDVGDVLLGELLDGRVSAGSRGGGLREEAFLNERLLVRVHRNLLDFRHGSRRATRKAPVDGQ